MRTAGLGITRVSDPTTQAIYASEFTYHPSGAVAGYRAGNTLLTTVTFDPARYWTTRVLVGGLDLTYS